MSALSEIFNRKKAFVAYVTAGDGGMDRTVSAMHALVDGGVDILEIGVPFSDPVADGPVIQAAADRSLKNGTTIDTVLRGIHQFKQSQATPVVLFGYYNPIFVANQSGDFFKRAKEAGVDGVLIVDVPLEECDDYYTQCVEVGIDPVLLLSPSTPAERVQKINEKSKGMLYYACRKGTTGEKSTLPEGFAKQMSDIKVLTTLPVIAGFGVSNKAMSAEILQHADGFVVGSTFVKAIGDGIEDDALTTLAKSLDPR